MLFTTLLASGLLATAAAVPATGKRQAAGKPARVDVSVSKNMIWTGSEEPYWTYFHGYDLCGPTHCYTDSSKKYTVDVPQSGGLNHQNGKGTLTITAQGEYDNRDPGWEYERHALIETLQEAIKASSVQKEYTIQIGAGCSPKQEFCNKEPKYNTIKYWQAPASAKAVIHDDRGQLMGNVEIKVHFEAEKFALLEMLSCETVSGAATTAIERVLKENPWAELASAAASFVCMFV
ncbi:hypothetical protein M011DRAFT_74530 [Sporormia fimetaria CBS 119925]|uniref:Uncharacterized protein n=1 Tax=Sporormia fimetaria CBS 119925 TaxID=1340428 RepID=A0A6A6VBF1_9PLEO|nr:hypothetical protein M011DRAFT_74530 [Sporormia fimetaria CBS 119925]